MNLTMFIFSSAWLWLFMHCQILALEYRISDMKMSHPLRLAHTQTLCNFFDPELTQVIWVTVLWLCGPVVMLSSFLLWWAWSSFCLFFNYLSFFAGQVYWVVSNDNILFTSNSQIEFVFSWNTKYKSFFPLSVVPQYACFLCHPMWSHVLLSFCRKRSRLWASATIATLCLIIPPSWWRMNCGWWWSCSVEVSHLALNWIDFSLIFTFTVTHVSSIFLPLIHHLILTECWHVVTFPGSHLIYI